MFQSKNKSFLSLSIMVFLLLCFFSLFVKEPILSVFQPQTSVADNQYPTIVLDAGHGGKDPGKVSEQGTLEKDINLSIVLKVKQLLSGHPVNVILTREDDRDLSTRESDYKISDLENRIQLIQEYSPVLAVSIHQNSYPDSSIDGAQVFYYTNSTDGKNLAALIQQELIRGADPSNHRKEKPNSSYYLLKNVSAPIVIVECGFLSNSEESKKLVDDTYQQTLAWTIHLGILQYLNDVVINSHTSK